MLLLDLYLGAAVAPARAEDRVPQDSVLSEVLDLAQHAGPRLE
jgi:hypothetical protein